MLVALTARDKPGAVATRMENRPDHVAYLQETGVVMMAGPLLDDEGEMCGSLIILDVADMTEAAAWAASDPYAKAGLFESVTLDPWKKVVG